MSLAMSKMFRVTIKDIPCSIPPDFKCNVEASVDDMTFAGTKVGAKSIIIPTEKVDLCLKVPEEDNTSIFIGFNDVYAYGKIKNTAIYSIIDKELGDDGNELEVKATMSQKAIKVLDVDPASLIGPKADLFTKNLARIDGEKYTFLEPGDFRRTDPFCYKYDHDKMRCTEVRCTVDAPSERPGVPVTYNFIGIPPTGYCDLVPFKIGLLFKNDTAAMFVKYCNVDGGLSIEPGEQKFKMTLFMDKQQTNKISFKGWTPQFDSIRDYMMQKLQPARLNNKPTKQTIVKQDKPPVVLKKENKKPGSKTGKPASASTARTRGTAPPIVDQDVSPAKESAPKRTHAQPPIVDKTVSLATASSSKDPQRLRTEPRPPTAVRQLSDREKRLHGNGNATKHALAVVVEDIGETGGIAGRLSRRRQVDSVVHPDGVGRGAPPTVDKPAASVVPPVVSNDSNVGFEEELEQNHDDVEEMETEETGAVDDDENMVVDTDEPMPLEENVQDDASNVEDNEEDIVDALSTYKMKNSSAEIAKYKADGFMKKDTSKLNLAQSQAGMQKMIDILNDMTYLDNKNAPPKKLKKKKTLLHRTVKRERNEQFMVPLVEGWDDYRGPFRKLSAERKAKIRQVMADDVYAGFNLPHNCKIVMGQFLYFRFRYCKKVGHTDSIEVFLTTRKLTSPRKAVKTQQVKKSRTKAATTLR